MVRSQVSTPGSKLRLKQPTPAAAANVPAGANGQMPAPDSTLQSTVNGPSPETNGKISAAPVLAQSGGPAQPPNVHAAELAEKVKELVRLSQEQGYLTYGDINDALPDTLITAEELDDIYVKLRNLEIEIVDQAEVDRVKQ